MNDLICLGTVVIDLYFKGDSLTYENDRFELAIGGKYFADTFYEGLGGGATNVAIGAKKQGLHVSLAATIGENVFQKVIQHKLNEVNLDHKLCLYQEDYYNISSVLVAVTGDRTIINYRSKRQQFYDTDDALEKLMNTKMIYLANMPNLSLDRKTHVLRFFKKKGIKTFSNLGVSDARKSFGDIRQFLGQLDVLIINCHEFAEMVRTPYEQINFKKNIKEEYLGSFADLIVVLTDGENGSYGYFEEKVYHQKAVKPEKAVDATGAGDAYTAGFIAAYGKSADIEGAMANGAKYAAEIIATVGSN